MTDRTVCWHMRRIAFVADGAAAPPDEDAQQNKRARPWNELPLARFVRTSRFEVLVADPRPTDIFSQSLSFNAHTHAHMQDDSARCMAFFDALVAHAHGKVVLEMGTGRAALLAVYAAQAGARQVYAVESDASSASAARSHIESLVEAGSLKHGQVIVLVGFSSSLTRADIPEPVDLVVHELLGVFASSEGVAHFFRAAQRTLLPPRCLSIPHRAASMLAPGVAPSIDLLSRVPDRHTAIGPRQKYLQVGRCGALPSSLLLDVAQPFEELWFNAPLDDLDGERPPGCEQRTLRFAASSAGLFEGCYAHMRFQAADGQPWVDSFAGSDSGQSTSWAVLFLPLNEPRHVAAGDSIVVTCTVVGGASRAPRYSFDFGGAHEKPTTLTLAELYPLDGGAWCRACAGTTSTVSEERREWLSCRECGDAYHRRCRWDGSRSVPCREWVCEHCATCRPCA